MAEEAEVEIDASTFDIKVIAFDVDEDLNWVYLHNDTPADFGRIVGADVPSGDDAAHPRS